MKIKWFLLNQSRSASIYQLQTDPPSTETYEQQENNPVTNRYGILKKKREKEKRKHLFENPDGVEELAERGVIEK